MTLPPVDVARDRARVSLEAARVLHEGGFHAEAVSRAYYAALYGASALLASIGVEATSHDGVRSQVSLHFVRTGKLSADAGRAFSHLASDRNDADYDFGAVFNAELSQGAIDDAEAYLRAVDALLSPAA